MAEDREPTSPLPAVEWRDGSAAAPWTPRAMGASAAPDLGRQLFAGAQAKADADGRAQALAEGEVHEAIGRSAKKWFVEVCPKVVVAGVLGAVCGLVARYVAKSRDVRKAP